MKAAEKIRQSIEESVRNGSLLPGDVIDEAELIARHGVSRTPVREALLRLHAQGVLTSTPRGGMRIAKMDVPQLLAMWELLAELEGVCVRLACERMPPDEREELARIHAESEKAVKDNDREAWRTFNSNFHEVLYRGSRNPYLRQEILRMRSRTGAYRDHAFAALDQIQPSWEQHGQIVQAISQRDEGRASQIMVTHLSPGQGAKGLAAFVALLPKELLE